jgi:hypothetical protein
MLHLCERRSYPVYTFVFERVNGYNIVCQIESSSKSEAIDRFLDTYNINIGTIGACKGYYFNKNGEIKEIDMLGAFKRRNGVNKHRGFDV